MAISSQQIIYKSLRMLGVLASGEAPTAAEAQDSLYTLNSLIDSFSSNPQYYYYTGDEAFVLTANQVAYAVGNTSVSIPVLTAAATTATATFTEPHGLETGNKITVSGAADSKYNLTAVVITVVNPTSFTYSVASGATSPDVGSPVFVSADFYVARPIRIVGAFVRTAANEDTPLGLVTEQYWNNIQDKLETSTMAAKLLYRPSAPFGQIILYPVPTPSTLALHLRAERMIYPYAELTSTQFLPPGYQRLLELALAVELASEYGSRVAPETAAYLKMTFADVMRTNVQRLPSSKIGAVPASNTYTDVAERGNAQ